MSKKRIGSDVLKARPSVVGRQDHHTIIKIIIDCPLNMSVNTGCCLNGRTAQPPSKSLIFWSFPNVLCLFDSSIWAIFIQVFLGHRIEKKSEKSHPQKSFNFRVGSNWHISLFLIFWVFCPQLPSKPSKLKCGGSFGKFREFAAR